MEKINNKTKDIFLTKQDTMTFYVKIKISGELYELQDGDKLYFSVKRNYSDEQPIIMIESVNNYIFISSEITKNMDVGKYFYDLQLNFANGEIKTIIGKTDKLSPRFVLWEEVTENE